MAIDTSLIGDTIIVHPGIYYENIYFNGREIVLSSLFLLSNDEADICSTRINGLLNGRSVVAFKNGESRKTVLIGFTLEDGYTDYGGGIYIREASPTLEHLHIIANRADRTGGGIYITGEANPIISFVIIERNLADVGAGISARYSSFTLNDALVNNNSAGTAGGGIQCSFTENVFINNSIISNNDIFSGQGGGIYLRDVSYISLNNVSVTSNRAFQGGGLHLGSVHDFHMENSIINNNVSDAQGGGVFSAGGIHKFETTLIFGNTASKGGGIDCVTATLLLENVTVCGNEAEETGGVYVFGNSTITNSIIWGNLNGEIESNSGQIIVLHSDIKNGQDSIKVGDNGQIQWLEGNVNIEPKFVNSDSSDFHLSTDSPCINTGIDFYVLDGDTLIDISPGRFKGDEPDMGAFEFAE